MSGYLRQSTASQSRAIGPFVDDTDYKTAETGLTIANTDIKLVVNGGASANKNSGGGTHRVNGIYGVTFDATDTATVGEMEVSVVVAGALPVFKTFTVLEEAVYDAMFAASAVGPLLANTTGTGLTAIPWNASWDAEVQSEVADALAVYDPPTNAEMEARTLVAANYATATALDTVDNFLDTEIAAIITTLGTPAGVSVSADIAAVKAQTAAIETDTAEIGAAGAGLTALASQTSVNDLPTNAELATALAAADDAVLAAIDALPTAAENTTAVLTTQMTEAYAADGAAPTLAQALFAIQQFLQERAITGTTLTVKKLDGTTAAMTFTLDDGTAPTSITRAT